MSYLNLSCQMSRDKFMYIYVYIFCHVKWVVTNLCIYMYIYLFKHDSFKYDMTKEWMSVSYHIHSFTPYIDSTLDTTRLHTCDQWVSRITFTHSLLTLTQSQWYGTFIWDILNVSGQSCVVSYECLESRLIWTPLVNHSDVTRDIHMNVIRNPHSL